MLDLTNQLKIILGGILSVCPFLLGTKIPHFVLLKKGNGRLRLKQDKRMSDHRKTCENFKAVPSSEENGNTFLLTTLNMLIMQETLVPSIFCYHSSAYREL